MQLNTTPKTPNKLPAEIIAEINSRIGDEYAAHYFYRNAANWCHDANYKKAAVFFDAEAVSELEHAQGLQNYLTQWNIIPEIPAAPTNVAFPNLVEIINNAYDMEFGLFEKYSAAQIKFSAVHAATFNFLQGYVNIQNEAIAEYSDLLNALVLIDPTNKFEVLYFENEYFG